MSGSTPNFRFIDLFGGIGGFHHALAAPEFGGECVFAADIDADCRAVYAATWPELAEAGRIGSDIRAFTCDADGNDLTAGEIDAAIPDHDVLCAGFPCQPFSKSGAQLGVLDQTRGTLFFDIVKIARVKQPRFLLLENVRNLAGPRHRETWATIVASLREIGYRVSDEPVIFSPHLLAPDAGGAPQIRDRVFILAARVPEGADKTQAPLVTRAPSAGWHPNQWNIEDYLQADEEIANLADFQLRREETAWIDAWNYFVQHVPVDDLPGFPIWVDEFRSVARIDADTPGWKAAILEKNAGFYREHRTFIRAWLRKSWIPGEGYRVADFPQSRRKFEWQARQAQPKQADRDLWRLTLHLRPSGLRVKPATYLPALVAITQTSIIGSRRRRITPVEAARLQGLPDWIFANAGVDDATAYKQAGNGVNVGAVQHVARALFVDAGLTWGQTGATGSPRLEIAGAQLSEDEDTAA